MPLAVDVGGELVDALSFAFGMTWEILWALILGFALSGVVQAVVTKSEMTRLLPDDRPKTLTVACGLGAASSSCSYAAVPLARSIFRKGSNFTAAMAFEFASTSSHPVSRYRMIPSSITRFVEANSKAMAAVKFEPL